MLRFPALLLLLFAAGVSAANRPVYPARAAKPVGPYTPGIFAGDLLYVSGQGVADADGKVAAAFDAQVRQCLDNVKAIVEAAGLTMKHVASTQVYLSDMANYAVMDRIYNQYFPANPPARVVIGVERMPTATPVEINAVAVRELAARKAAGPAVSAAGRLFFPAVSAAGPDQAVSELRRLLRAAGAAPQSVVSLNAYFTPAANPDALRKAIASAFSPAPPVTLLRVASLPAPAAVALSAIAVPGPGRHKTYGPCVSARGTLYCSAVGPANTSAPVDEQVREAMNAIGEALKQAGLSYADIASSNVYLDDLDRFPDMNRTYGSFYTGPPPARTTVQPSAPGQAPAAQISVTAASGTN